MGYDAFRDVVTRASLEIEHQPMKRLDLDGDHIVTLYRAGVSELAIARRLGVSRRPIRRILIAQGIEPRGRGAATRVRMSHLTPVQRLQLTEAAHAAKRGRPNSDEALERSAQTRQRTRHHESRLEAHMAAMLNQRGIDTVAQQAIGRYNCDLGAAPVAVEIFGGNFHWHGRHLARLPKRSHDLFDRGWDILVIWAETRWPLSPRAADYASAYIERRRREPTAIREYRVIRGDGELVAQAGPESDDRAFVPA